LNEKADIAHDEFLLAQQSEMVSALACPEIKWERKIKI
jgi:hypothetical protein